VTELRNDIVSWFIGAQISGMLVECWPMSAFRRLTWELDDVSNAMSFIAELSSESFSSSAERLIKIGRMTMAEMCEYKQQLVCCFIY
jgi:hypothetical protein